MLLKCQLNQRVSQKADGKQNYSDSDAVSAIDVQFAFEQWGSDALKGPATEAKDRDQAIGFTPSKELSK